uniref:Galectin n=1 Tax=Cyprinus carpio TaxID=7962 RepID=A0A8C1LI66_CYPCA
EERLQDGMTITVCGRVPSDSNRFQVDLQYVSDIILHFNPRYERGGYVVHNTLQNVGWGSEEWKYENPFPRDRPFLCFSVYKNDLFISTNGKPFSEYKHRLPSSHVNSICVGGQVEVNLIAFQYLGVMFCPYTWDEKTNK